MKKLIVALAMTSLMVMAIDISYALAEPKPKEGNPGLPGSLAEVNQLQQVITDQQTTILGLQGQVAELQASLDAMKNYAPVAQTGQSLSYYNYDDGWYKMGVPLPELRFVDNGDGTVTDNLTGLTWQQNFDYHGPMDWYSACDACNNMADDGQYLVDGSQPGDWRLPNIKELLSLYNYGQREMPSPPFLGPVDWQCWSSTTAEGFEGNAALYLYFSYGWTGASTKTVDSVRVLCVRGGQQ
jgi:hypothetical protein